MSATIASNAATRQGVRLRQAPSRVPGLLDGGGQRVDAGKGERVDDDLIAPVGIQAQRRRERFGKRELLLVAEVAVDPDAHRDRSDRAGRHLTAGVNLIDLIIDDRLSAAVFGLAAGRSPT